MPINDFNGKALIIVSSTAQIEMFRLIVDYLDDYSIKFVNTEIFFMLPEMEYCFRRYGLDFMSIDNWSMEIVYEILRSENPDIIVTGHDQNPMDILFIKACNELGLPSLTVQDGLLAASRTINESFFYKLEYIFIPFRVLKLIFNPNRSFKYKINRLWFEYKYGGDYSFVYGHGDSSKIALFGDTVKNMLISEGVSSERLEVTGNSKFDNLIQFKDPLKKDFLKEKFEIPSDKKVILVLTQWFVEAGLWSKKDREYFIVEIAKACVNLKDVQLVIKLHPPYEKEADYREILKDLPISPLIYNFQSLHEIICISDVVVSVSSTAALEAMALNKPLLIVNMDHGSKLFKDGGVLFIEKQDQILNALEKLLYHPQEFVDEDKMRQFVFNQAYIIDGNASERISDLMREMVHDNRLVYSGIPSELNSIHVDGFPLSFHRIIFNLKKIFKENWSYYLGVGFILSLILLVVRG
ncbi:MAG: UDP-N-acetylglucosamine 2-epimerase [Methanobacterium sp.]